VMLLIVKPAWPIRSCHCWMVRSLPFNIVCSSSSSSSHFQLHTPWALTEEGEPVSAHTRTGCTQQCAGLLCHNQWFAAA
jgi:hypothetical protein